MDEINRLTLLDGHHRFEHLTLYKYDLQIPIVIISNDDVNIESYNSEINVDLEKFEYILKENNFTTSYTSKYFLTFQGKQYSSEGIHNIYDLYDFKIYFPRPDPPLPYDTPCKKKKKRSKLDHVATP